MVRTRKERKAATVNEIKLAHPDRSAVPSENTLLKLAQDRDLFEQAEKKQRKNDGNDDEDEDEDEELLPPTVDRAMDAVLWSASLAMLHFTLDVLVQHQYAISIIWPQIIIRAIQAFFGKILLLKRYS
ncbi:uncharacterized protein F4822DRAFT_3224 [Hypoxylon trugodes]|uniref:uncharacterized protein n=1 Tax=Hypoxylon trugodes TaxID=326681 RepID=UPI0021975F9E|nr:uncharacterized protein F4822DRAFT_3224 [Hypoxylon trugodes]KAI1393194.1 hypothetical protein F4822DRAFT_3224 [Hypoxylon trugodes]